MTALALLAAACSSGPPAEGGSGPPGSAAPATAAPTGQAAPLPGPARTEVSGTAWRGDLVVAGGLTADARVSDAIHRYDPVADEWEALPALPVALHHTALAVLDDRLLVIGGFRNEGGQWIPEDRVWMLDAPDGAWEAGPTLGTPRGALAAAATGDVVHAVGGVAPDGEVLATTERLARGAAGWEPGPGLATPREHLAATAVDGEVYVIGGRVGSMASNHATVETLDRATVPDLLAARGGIAAASLDGRPCVAGGEEPAGTIATVECLGEGAWEVVASLRIPRHGLAAVALRGRLHVVGGGPDPGLTVSRAHEVVTPR